jgi:tetratricopeptide (TPR) repeat protein
MSTRSLALVPFTVSVLLISLAGCGDSDEPADQAVVVEESSANTEQIAQAESKKQATALVEEAIPLIQQHQLRDAIEKLNKAVETDRECAEGYFQRAGILADAGEDQLALNDYSRAVELSPDEVRYHNMRGLFLLTRKQPDTALTDFTTAIQIDPKYVQAWNNRGLVRLAQNQFEEAVDDFNHAIEIDPEYADGFNNRGFAYFQQGNDQQAFNDFNQTIELNPDYVNAYNNRGMLFMRSKQYQDAIADFSEAIRLDEINVKHYQNRKAACEKLGQTEQAEADGRHIAWLLKLGRLNATVAQNPAVPDAYILRANHLADGGQTEIAMTNFERAIEVAPDSAAGLVGRAEWWFRQGNLQKTIDDATSALEKEPSHKALALRGDAWFGLGRYDEAIVDFTTARRLDDTVALAYFRRAQQRSQQGDTAGAQADLAMAQRLNPSIGQ